MSTTVLPGPRPASSPSGPSATALSAFVSVTITKVTSAAFATAPGESAHRRPLSSSHCAFDLVRLWPVTVCPFASSRSAVRPPIAPRPTYPRFAISVVESRTPCPAMAGRDSRGTNRKYSLEQRRVQGCEEAEFGEGGGRVWGESEQSALRLFHAELTESRVDVRRWVAGLRPAHGSRGARFHKCRRNTSALVNRASLDPCRA